MPEKRRYSQLPPEVRRDLERRVWSEDIPDYKVFQAEVSPLLGGKYSRSSAGTDYLAIKRLLLVPGLFDRPEPEALPTDVLIQEFGALSFQERMGRARLDALAVEIERRQRQPTTANP